MGDEKSKNKQFLFQIMKKKKEKNIVKKKRHYESSGILTRILLQLY